MNHTQLQRRGLSFFLMVAILAIGATFNIKKMAAVSPIDNLQPGEWYEVPNSKIRAVIPNPIPPGNGPVQIIKAWNGGMYDTRRDNFIVWGGGHGDYAGNEMYAFNLNTLQWLRAWGPSALASMTPAGSSTCPDTYTDGMPAARHTYGGLEYLPNVDKFFSMGGSLWCGSGSPTNSVWTFDFTSQSWVKKGPITPIAGRWSGLELGVNAAYDPNTGHLFATSPTTELLEYDPLTDIWKMRGSVTAKYSMTSAIDSRRKYMISIGNASPYGAADTLGTIYRYNLTTTGTITQEKIVSTGATEILSAPAPAFQYDPVSDQYVAWKGGSDVYTLNPDTFVWTRRPAAATNTVTPTQPTEWGTFGRFRYIPSKNLFILVNSIDENVYIYKLSQGAGTPALTPPAPIVDTIAPSVALTGPSANATVSGTITVSADATDAGGIAGVQFKIDGAFIGTEDTTSPYAVSLNTTLFSDGTHSLMATARDTAGNQKVSTAVSITILNTVVSSTPPSQTIAPPVTNMVTQVNIPSGVFVALDRPDRGKGVAMGTKHTNWAHNPIDGRLYQTGGDFGGSIGYASYRQESFSLSIADRFANKTDRNAGWRLEYPYCGPDGGVQPKSPDFVGWAWDSKRKVFWFVPGLSVTPGTTNCVGETADGADNPKYLMNHLMTFNPFEPDLAKRWKDMGKNVGPNYYGTWQSDYDPQTDTLIRLGRDSNNTAVADVYNIQTNTWTEYKLGTNALSNDIRIWAEGHATDIPGRAIYTIDGQAGRLFRYNIDAHTITDLGPVPGGRLNVWGSNDTYLAWDSVNKVVFFFRLDNNTLYVYHPDTKTWETMPNVTQPAGLTPHTRHGMVFDPYQNVLVLLGYSDEDIPDTNMYLYRYAPGGSTQYTVTNTPPASTSTSSSSTGTGTTSTTGGTTAGSTTTVADVTPPTVAITNPSSNNTVSGTIMVAANAADAGGIAGVQFMIDGTPLGAENTAGLYTQSLDTTIRSNGLHVLTAVARDKAGNKKVSAVVIITISNVSAGTTAGTTSGTKEQGATGAVSSGGSTSSSSAGTSSGSTGQTSGASSGVSTGTVAQDASSSAGGAPSPANPLTYSYSSSTGTAPSSTNIRTGGEQIKRFEKPLYPGLNDQEVARLQKVFIDKGYLPAGNDSGYFGPATREAVEKFQCAQGIVCGGEARDTGYGLVGSTTRSRLNEIITRAGGAGTASAVASSATSSTSATQGSATIAGNSTLQTPPQKAFTKPLFPGLRNSEVKALQDFLAQKGYLVPGTSTGYFGPATREAVKKFQCAQGIICSGNPRDTGYGLVGNATRNKLNELQK